MDASHLLKWHYLVFWLPFAVGALLLALSMLSMGDGDGDSDGADGADDSSDGDGADGGDADHSDGDGADGDAGDDGDGRRGGAHHPMPLLALLGAGKAPTSIVLEAFAMSWGFAGFWANQLLLGGVPDPEFATVLPSLGIALGGGAIGARGAAEMIHRLLPKTETSAVSRNSLLMRTGKVLFAVTETTGRLRVYDEHGTLHEHPCRVRPGTPAIAKGKTARVIDIDPRTEGLIVEETVG